MTEWLAIQKLCAKLGHEPHEVKPAPHWRPDYVQIRCKICDALIKEDEPTTHTHNQSCTHPFPFKVNDR